MQRIIIIDDTNCKPLLEDFLKMLKVHVKYDLSIGDDTMQTQLLLDSMKKLPYQKRIPVKSEGNIYLTDISSIIRVETCEGKSVLFITDQKKLTNNEHIDSWQEKLCDSGFLRVHRDHLVNIAGIVKLQFGEDPFLVLENGDKIPVDINDQQNIAGNLEKFL